MSNLNINSANAGMTNAQRQLNYYGLRAVFSNRSRSQLKHALELGADPTLILDRLIKNYYYHTSSISSDPTSVKYPYILEMIIILLNAGGNILTKKYGYKTPFRIIMDSEPKDLALIDFLYKRDPSLFDDIFVRMMFNMMHYWYRQDYKNLVILYLWGIAHGLIPMYHEDAFSKTKQVHFEHYYFNQSQNPTEFDFFAKRLFGPLVELTKYVNLLSNKNIQRCLTLMFGAEKASEMISRAVTMTRESAFNRRAPLLGHWELLMESEPNIPGAELTNRPNNTTHRNASNKSGSTNSGGSSASGSSSGGRRRTTRRRHLRSSR